jgi:integral membrane sensor domain MASE1
MLLVASFHMKQDLQSIAQPILSITDVIGLILVEPTGVNTRVSKKNWCTFIALLNTNITTVGQ